MRVYNTDTPADQLQNTDSPGWRSIADEKIAMIPSLVELTGVVSPYLASTRGHGKIREIAVRMAHDGQTISIRLEWANAAPRDEISDLDQFVDAAAVMFASDPLTSAISMGAIGNPVNTWLWRADEDQPYDVVAQGYGSSQRRSGAISSLTAQGQHADDRCAIVLQRPLLCDAPGCVSFVPGTTARIAFAVWSGENNERSGQKSVSGEFVPMLIAG